MVGGILLVDKPAGLSSYRVVEKILRRFRIKKGGHLGTLDPKATGLLPICINEATKIVQFLINEDKEYEGTMVLGITTDSGDMDGELIKEENFQIKEKELKATLKKFRGEYLQTPPMYSAVKQGGRRLYELAREGKQIERKKRRVTIYSLEILFFSPPYIKFRVACSKGTYIRSLVNDIGEKMGCGATLRDLRRMRVGSFSIEDARPLEEILQQHDIEGLIDIKTALSKLPTLIIKSSFERNIRGGTPIYREAVLKKNFELYKGLVVKVSSEEGGLISVARCIRKEEDLAKLAWNGIVFNHIRVFSKPL